MFNVHEIDIVRKDNWDIDGEKHDGYSCIRDVDFNLELNGIVIGNAQCVIINMYAELMDDADNHSQQLSEFVEFIDDNEVGFIPPDVHYLIYISEVNVDKAFRGNGLANRLINSIYKIYQDECSFDIAMMLKAYPLDGNDVEIWCNRLAKYYSRIGFEEVGNNYMIRK